MMTNQEKLVHYILLAAEENGGEFPNIEQYTPAQQQVIRCVLEEANEPGFLTQTQR